MPKETEKRIRDPVSDFLYPEEWSERCSNTGDLRLVREGLAVLTSDGNILMRGFTTGSTAAAACKAAVLSLKKYVTDSVSIRTASGIRVNIKASGESGTGRSAKYSGDYKNDITSELLFIAIAEENPERNEFIAGEGIGRFSRDTPRYGEGSPAISNTSMKTITEAIDEALYETKIPGVTVTLSIPNGEEIGRRTLNPKVGVEGGISVLGSTGFVEPWDDHLSESVFDRIRAAEKVVITTGRIGLRFSRMLFPDYEAVLVGKYMEKGILAAEDNLILCGLPALILKFIDPEILSGTPYLTVEEMTIDPEWKIRAKKSISHYRRDHSGVRIVIINRNGGIEIDSSAGEEEGEFPE
ncbi:cobalt-precorrin-5B (C(1))-methyltransferase [Methanoplanus endosymbiosus]|uniref:Cobalt-precorrin-5B C(1)-methyltransferase n=1 Tax=Methanoplanus endosymbiosus TaxID=33865 RepID=A0A9E7PSE3_9EURY|nr:cobalt-precorrin-5B (C(1))-methyltransferase [Methanoplanus endosymbiosus]UUX92827.1 cobalt-precorrin-5B (C(1))-methyltransferase [Methanoplanus endosymbiosus]